MVVLLVVVLNIGVTSLVLLLLLSYEVFRGDVSPKNKVYSGF
ncbi:hypothetical protein CWATWH0402_930 [Crocosphaera watsonii WH 0402]|uniref:Uncharacterized protein n=1 Tax=Crocosphaera watsonii WH 0402 TaxID=1284629 RepID=T2JIM6_CROWT|nr:hypothetical protein CWATWH0402_930 [Crocosphaera watsonii WH 0402]